MSTYAKQRNSPKLRQIGTWATWWWALSCGYFLLLTLMALDTYRAGSVAAQESFLSVTQHVFAESVLLQIILGIILVGWIIGARLWFGELKRQRIKYGVALKDLFFTIRK